jgi:hypothetical protein
MVEGVFGCWALPLKTQTLEKTRFASKVILIQKTLEYQDVIQSLLWEARNSKVLSLCMRCTCMDIVQLVIIEFLFIFVV